ncbi:MAG: phospholipid carrier-dependent glycosyltransferase [Sphingobium sp.]|nr:phospholipid carrier-dependent glycosyltransferase [Sphingobium sp.]
MGASVYQQDSQSRPEQRDILIAGALALLSLALFLWRIGDPAKLDFDETHYVPAARTLLALDALPNTEHPPLGKLFIGLGMLLFGDNPLGWRVMSALSGALLVFSAVMATRWLFLRRPAALMAGLLLIFSQTLFVQARIAMLDIFMASFLMLALWQLVALWRTGFSNRARFVVAGGALGLSMACKWTALSFIVPGLPSFVWLLWRAQKQPADAPPLPMAQAVGWLGPFTLLAYLATFLPYHFLRHDPLSLIQIVPQQFEMLHRQSAPMGSHPYQSRWWEWVLDLRPVWYFYEPVAGVQRGVLLIGNPAICWGGLVALAASLWAGLRQKVRPLLLPVLLWAGPLLFFIAAPKPVQFYYHYFLSSLMLCIASAGALDHYFWSRGKRLLPWLAIGLAGLVFLEFYPIISASALGDPQDFNRWMWFDSWR